ncbi:MAG: PAS domain-containing protein [Deltaproteobacteria bacterium]|nr:PAS domain-containing protein [Deltaproteobacteria bacterium]
MVNTGASLQKIATGDFGKGRLIKSFLILLYLFSVAYTYYLFDETSRHNQSFVSSFEEENGKLFLPLGFHTFQAGDVSASIIEDQNRKVINVVINPTKAVEYNGFGFNVNMDVPFNSYLVLKLRNNSGGKQIFINVTDSHQGGEQFFKPVALKPHSLNEFRIPLNELQRNEWQPSGASKDGQLNSDGIAIIAISIAPGSPLDINLLSLGFEWGISTIYFYTYFAMFVFTGLLLLWKKFPHESLKTPVNVRSINYFIYFMCGAIGIYFSNSLVFQADRHCYITLLIVLAVTILDHLLYLKGWFAEIWAFRYIIALSPVYYLKANDPAWAIPLLFLTLMAHTPFLSTYRFYLIFLTLLMPLVIFFLKGMGNFQAVVKGLTALIGGSLFSYLFIFFQQNRRDRIEAEHKDQLIKGILETSSDGILLLDPKGEILSSNAGFQKMVSQREEVIVGLNLKDFILKASQDVFIINDGALDLKLKGKDDKPLYVFLRIQNLYKGNKLSGYIATISDITERKKAEEALRQNEERYRDLFDNAPIGYIEIDKEGRITAVNNAELDMLGYTYEKIIGKYIWNFGLVNAEKKIKDILGGKENPAKGLESDFRRKDGSLVPVLIDDVLLKDESGGIVGLRCVHRDIREIKQAKEEKDKFIKELRDALSKVRTLSGMLPICSHCKKIRDDKGYWNQIESFIRDHSEAEFSHSVCPECADKLYGNEGWYIEMKKEKDKK